MSISGISSMQSPYQPGSQSSAQGLGGYMQQLASALQSGNLSSAQQAYGGVESSLQGIQGSSAASGTSSSQGGSFLSQLQQAMNQIGSDLQSGNLPAAKTAFTNLQQQLQSAAAASATTSTSSGAATGTTINMVA